MIYDIGQIKKILPQRYPMLLIDRVLELEPGKSCKALKNVTGNEAFFQGHFEQKIDRFKAGSIFVIS